MPFIAQKCIDSWHKYCPDFEMKLWNESNFDVNINKYSKDAAKVNQWAFVADIARLFVIYSYGGVYLDVDVEVIKPINNFLNNQMFLSFESNSVVNMGSGFGAEKKFYLLKKMLDSYDGVPFIHADGTINTTASPKYTTASIKSEGFLLNNSKQTVNNATIYPSEYFCPKDWRTGEMNITENTHTIHHFLASWWSDEERKLHEKRKGIIKLYKKADCKTQMRNFSV
jgi:hypothetical protein